jgi:FtsP/CotA-like multicopper oxidase with cupredoxin domain
VTVHNQIVDPEEGTSLHWHGLFQVDTPWMDGIPSGVFFTFTHNEVQANHAVTQCPIPPNHTFTYVFRADRVGTSWW